jgi:GT2 family glycosyltransferase
VSSPLVTVSVLVYGPSPWLPQVVDALVQNTALPYELVIVDNGTNDETRAFIAGIDGARVLTPGRNLGFGVGHDAAANIARGEYLCMLNSDAVVPPGWLDALVAPLAADPTVGATAPVYVYPDGRLQEAGATVEPSGQVIAFGRFDDASKAEYRLAGRVPFASAACLVTRTTTFREIGGFDARYGVAYYEDVEFTFALLDRGLHLELVATVQVVHAQGASSETSSDAERLLLGNRERFRRRWEPLLVGRPFVFDRPEAHHLAAARDFDACDRVLIVTDPEPVPAPNDSSVAAILVGQCHAHLRDGRVTVAGRDAAATRDAWLERGVEVIETADVLPFLAARRFHYAAVFTVTPASADIHDIVRATQPQARVAEAPPRAALGDGDAFEGWLGSLDLIPRLVS